MKRAGQIPFFAGAAVCLLIRAMPLKGLSSPGVWCLGLTLMTVIWWAAQVAQPGYISGTYLMLLYLLRVADTKVIFSGWTESTIWLVPGAYLIALAVRKSGLGERLSYLLIRRFVRGWYSMILAIFALSLVLSLLIPHPWPRSLLLMSVISVVIRDAELPQREAAVAGFTVYASAVPLSLVFLTADSINMLAASYTGETVSFIRWFLVMGPPALLLAGLTLLLIMVLFPPEAPVRLDLERVEAARSALGKVTGQEWRTLVWIVLAVALWMTNGITGLDIGWITMLVAMMMSMPGPVRVLNAADWREVPFQVMVFLTAAVAIGRVGMATGMNQWIAETLLPREMPENFLLLALLIALTVILIHMFMGSVIAVLGIVIPTFLTAAQNLGVAPMAVAGLVYLCVAGHYLLPFHHLSILVGQGEENGMYTQWETLRLGIPLTGAVLIAAAAAVGWWKLIGLL